MDLPALQQAAQKHVASLAQTDDDHIPASLPENLKTQKFNPADLSSTLKTLTDQKANKPSSQVNHLQSQIYAVLPLRLQETHTSLLVLELYLRDTQHHLPKSVLNNLRTLLIDLLRPSTLFAEKSPFAPGASLAPLPTKILIPLSNLQARAPFLHRPRRAQATSRPLRNLPPPAFALAVRRSISD